MCSHKLETLSDVLIYIYLFVVLLKQVNCERKAIKSLRTVDYFIHFNIFGFCTVVFLSINNVKLNCIKFIFKTMSLPLQ